MRPVLNQDRTLGIRQALPRPNTRKKRNSPTTTRTTLPRAGATKHPTHKQHRPANFKQLTATSKHARKRTRTLPRAIAAVAIVVALGVGGFFGYQQIAFAGPVTATVNGEKMTLEGSERSIEGLLDNNIVQVTPGNFVAVDESTLREGDGAPVARLSSTSNPLAI